MIIHGQGLGWNQDGLERPEGGGSEESHTNIKGKVGGHELRQQSHKDLFCKCVPVNSTLMEYLFIIAP